MHTHMVYINTCIQVQWRNGEAAKYALLEGRVQKNVDEYLEKVSWLVGRLVAQTHTFEHIHRWRRGAR